jgi:hypothetical protein
VKSKEVKTGCNLAESSMEGYGPKRGVLPMMTVMYSFSLFTYGLLSNAVSSSDYTVSHYMKITE